MRPRLQNHASASRPAGAKSTRAVLSRKHRSEGWLRRRRASMQPWRRGRIRPSTCRDLAQKE